MKLVTGLGLLTFAALLATGVAAQDATGQAAAAGESSKWSTAVVPGKVGDELVVTTQHGETIKKVTDYFNGLERLQGRFSQVDAENKQSRGKFYLMRPGRFRFEYGYGIKKVVISDGTYLAVQDLDLNSDDTYELDRTPFRLLLRKDVDLTRDATILAVSETEETIAVRLKDKDPDAVGMIHLLLTKKPSLELAGWKIIDAQGLETTVDLVEVSRPEILGAELFKRELLFKKKL